MSFFEEMLKLGQQATRGDHTNDQAPTPGKSTQVQQDHNDPTRNRYVDDGLHCDKHDDETGCYLPSDKRHRVLEQLQQRLLAAQAAYYAALGEVRVDELLRPKEDPSWIGVLLLESISFGLSTVVGHIGSRIMNVAEQKMAAQAWGVASDPTFQTSKVWSAIAKAPTGPVKKIVDTSIGLGKKSVSSALKTEADGKTSTLGLISIMQRESALVFQDIRENAIAGLDDLQLMQLWYAYDARFGHTVAEYKHQIQELISKFKKAELHKLGDETEFGFGNYTTVTRMLHWKREMFTGRRRLAMYEGQWSHNPDVGVVTKVKPKFERYVPDELVDASIELHTAKFGRPPEDLDDE